MVNEIKLPSFAKPVNKQDAVAVYASWSSGDSMAFVAENARMSIKKVSEIISAFPKEWQADVTKYRRYEPGRFIGRASS